MWITLLKKLPTRPSPPKLSIFWSVLWPGPDNFFGSGKGFGKRKSGNRREVIDEFSVIEMCRNCGEHILHRVGISGQDEMYCGCDKMPQPATAEDMWVDPTEFGKTPNWAFARRIHYQGVDLRVFPHEFNPIMAEDLMLLITGDDQSGPTHELVPEGVAAQREIDAVLDGETRPVYEAALNDGATHAQALLVAIGQDITLEDPEFPPAVGWFRPYRWAAKVFCYDWEMKEE